MLLELKDISYIVDNKEILRDINLKVEFNKFIVITGPNGSGKSTLMKLVMGFIKPTSGKIYFNEIDITDYTVDQRAKLGISYAFQQPIKFKGLTVKDILNIASNYVLDEIMLKDILNKVGLVYEEYINRELDDTLSGGEHKRIEIATVLLRKNILTIFDEPEAGIDLWSFNELISLFKKYKNDNGTTMIVSHQEKILKIAEELILLSNGKIKSVGTYGEVIGGNND